MSQFYLSKTDATEDVRRCKESIHSRQPIEITGVTQAGQVRLFKGVVQAIEEDRTWTPARWRVTISD